MIPPNVRISADPEELAHSAAEKFLETSLEAVTSRGRFRVALSGGSTPKTLYQLLASRTERYLSQIPWTRSDFFWTDERCVPPTHADSNFRMANDAMLSPAQVPPENIHRIKTERPHPNEAAIAYEETLRSQFRVGEGGFPRFDLILLGIGTEGHTASIFPDSEVLTETKRLSVAVWVEKLRANRITLTLPILNNANLTVFLVSGKDKASILHTVLQSPRDPGRYPAQAIMPTHGELLWLVDEAAATELNGN
jgi:6-phosphogluconolactonase